MSRADEASKTILELEAAGFTHVRIDCADCGHQTQASLLLMRVRGMVAMDGTLAQLTQRIRCAKCRRKPAADWVRPVRRRAARNGAQ